MMDALTPHSTVDPEELLCRTIGGKALINYRIGQIVYAQGDPADCVFYIKSGSVKASVLSEHGKQGVVSVLKRGSFFGEECAAGQQKRAATVSAIAECATMQIEKTTMIRLLREEPAFAASFIAYLVTRANRVQGDLMDQLFNSNEKRLARALLLLANFGKEGRLEPIVPKISQETLAEMVGTTRSRINHFMIKFRKLGLIDYNGQQIEVRNSLLHVILHDELVGTACRADSWHTGMSTSSRDGYLLSRVA